MDAASLLTPSRQGMVEVPPWDRTPDVAGTVASIRSAGDLFAGEGLLNQMHTRSVRPSLFSALPDLVCSLLTNLTHYPRSGGYC